MYIYIYQTTQFEYRSSGSPRALRFSPHVQVPRRRLRRWRQMSRCHERTRRSELWMARFPVNHPYYTLLIYITYYLVVGFKYFLFSKINEIILPIDELIFFKMVKTTNQFCIYIYTFIYIHTFIHTYIYMVLPLETTAELQPCKSVTKPRKYQ